MFKEIVQGKEPTKLSVLLHRYHKWPYERYFEDGTDFDTMGLRIAFIDKVPISFSLRYGDDVILYGSHSSSYHKADEDRGAYLPMGPFPRERFVAKFKRACVTGAISISTQEWILAKLEDAKLFVSKESIQSPRQVNSIGKGGFEHPSDAFETGKAGECYKCGRPLEYIGIPHYGRELVCSGCGNSAFQCNCAVLNRQR